MGVLRPKPVKGERHKLMYEIRSIEACADIKEKNGKDASFERGLVMSYRRYLKRTG